MVKYGLNGEETVKYGLNGEDNHDNVVAHLEPDILECEVK